MPVNNKKLMEVLNKKEFDYCSPGDLINNRIRGHGDVGVNLHINAKLIYAPKFDFGE